MFCGQNVGSSVYSRTTRDRTLRRFWLRQNDVRHGIWGQRVLDNAFVT